LLANPALATNEKGTCPPASGPLVSIPQRETPEPPTTDVHYAGTVTMVLFLSNTGYLCDLKVVKGVSEVLDKQAVDAIRQQLMGLGLIKPASAIPAIHDAKQPLGRT
jgi:hypothetical protein